MRSRARLPNEPPLLEPERAIRLAEEAAALARAPAGNDRARALLADMTAMDAAHLALETAIDTGDPRVLDAALELATRRVLGWGAEHFDREIASAAKPILSAVPRIDNIVRDCAGSRSSCLRACTARGLGERALRSMRGESPDGEDETDAEAAGIVFALTKDEDADVRAAAREALGGAAPPAWATFFPRDPLASMPAAEAARLRGPLDRAAEALEKGVLRDARPLAEAVGELPDELVRPILDAWIRTRLVFGAKNVEPLLQRWIALDPDGERTALWLRGMSGGSIDLEAGARLGAVLARRPPAEACAIALAVARILTEQGHEFYVHLNAEALLARSWPDDADPTPLLELALGASLAEAAGVPRGEPSVEVNEKLVAVALAHGTIDRLIEHLVVAFVGGMPGRWARVHDAVSERLLTFWDPRLRAHADVLLREGEGAPLTWALRYLTGAGHQPGVDQPVSDFIRDATHDPRLASAIASDEMLRKPAQDLLREQLAAGKLSPEGALAAAQMLFERDDESSLRPAEWAALRRAREGLADPADRAFTVLLLPGRARWTPDDHAFIDGLIDEHGHDPLVIARLAVSLGPYACPELVPLVERLEAHASADFARELVRRTLAACRREPS